MKNTSRVCAAFLALMLLFQGVGTTAYAKTKSEKEEKTVSEEKRQSSRDRQNSVLALFGVDGPGDDFGAAWTNSDIEGEIDEDTEVRLQDDFYTAINKDWILSQDISEDNPQSVQLMKSDDIVNDRLLSIVSDMDVDSYVQNTEVGMTEDEIVHAAELVRIFADAVGDTDKRAELGAEPIRPYLEKIEAISSLDELSAYLTDFNGDNLIGTQMFDFGVQPFFSRPEEYSVIITPPQPAELALQDAKDYSNMSNDGLLHKEIYNATVRGILGKLGYGKREINKHLAAFYQFERRMADHMEKAHMAQMESSAKKYDREYSFDELTEMVGDYPMAETLKQLGFDGANRFFLYEPDHFKNVKKIYKERHLEEMKSYCFIKTAFFAYDLLDVETRNAYNETAGLSIPETTEDDVLQEYLLPYLPAPLNMVYIAAHCTAEQKREVQEMTELIKQQEYGMLKNADWITEDGRKKAVEKLDCLLINAVYPDKYISYDGLTLTEDQSLVEMARDINFYNVKKYAYRVNQKYDRSEWDLSELPTTTCNAMNVVKNNKIMILAGILADGFTFSPDAEDEVNLARLGTIVGHEITHSFDSNGYFFNKEGWYTDLSDDFEFFGAEDKTTFQKRISQLTMWYGALSPVPGSSTYSGDVSAEAMADMGGMKTALAVGDTLDGFDFDLFFRSYAQLWRKVNTLELEKAYAQGDVHPLSFLRTNVTVQQFDKFMETYDVQKGDGMYLSPKKRILVW